MRGYRLHSQRALTANQSGHKRSTGQSVTRLGPVGSSTRLRMHNDCLLNYPGPGAIDHAHEEEVEHKSPSLPEVLDSRPEPQKGPSETKFSLVPRHARDSEARDLLPCSYS
jgi:hypothetical protein